MGRVGFDKIASNIAESILLGTRSGATAVGIVRRPRQMWIHRTGYAGQGFFP